MESSMKYHILILFSLLLVGSFSNSYAETGDFITGFDGSNGGTAFDDPTGIAVDSNGRIIVADSRTSLVQIFNPDGSFFMSFDGTDGIPFVNPFAVAVDSNDRIIVSDTSTKRVQIFNPDGSFVTSFGSLIFATPNGVAVDSNDRIIVTDTSLVHIYNSDGRFVTSFDGVPELGFIYAVAVDSNNNIIVTDINLKHVRIFDSDGKFLTIFDGSNGGTEFISPVAIAVDNNDRIIVSDINTKLVQIYNSEGLFLASFDGSSGNTFQFPFAVAVDSNDNIIVSDTFTDLVQIFEGFSIPEAAAELSKPSGSGCSGDCTPPTIGLNLEFQRVVENGFSYNNNPVDVIAWHTPYPLITATVNQINTVEITAYDNQGIFYLDMVQFGLGLEDFGQSLHDVEVLIEVHLEPLYSENKVIVEKVVIRDRDNLIDTYSVFAVTETVQCMDDKLDNECLKITLQYSYREATINNMMVVNVVDNSRNSQNFYLNDGVEVIGESMNIAPYVIISNKQTSQQTENLTLTLTRTDKVNHIWMDENGIEYLKVSENRFDRITPQEPYKCTDQPLDEINVPTRNNCHFRDLTELWRVL